MGKLEYLDALKRALMGLPPETQARTLAWYEQRFVDGSASGRPEHEVAEELGDPRQVAVTLRTSAHLSELKDKKPATNIARTIVSGIGLLIFNLFMLIPAAVFASLLMSLYLSAFGVYVSGIAVTASGLAGSNELVLSAPLTRMVVSDDGEQVESQTRVTIGANGIHVFDEPAPMGDGGDGDARAERDDRNSRFMRGAEAVAERKIQITTEMDPGSRTTQVALGCALVLGGIALFLLAIVLTKYTLLGIRRYVNMNLSLLKG
ncbi:DUF1700 domain-containing protein [Telluria beijingensis]|uniref:DUF1700 domain-containing protein n=1 Tax=Telluria beijingensis TaxID=3068633 RepID=UPI002795C6BA|nr:DUF1700 domain-containing protein [Massilia sp. REN29]